MSGRYLRQWLILGAIALLGYAGIVFLAYVDQRSMLYFPTHLDVTTGMSLWRVDGEFIGYARETPSPPRVWLMLHGNGGQAAHREYILRCVAAADSVFVLEYPGYGFRAGRPSQQTIDDAASAAYRELLRRFPGVPIGVIGESLGSGPACALARQARPPDRIVLITPFDSLVKLAAEYKWYLPVRLILKDRWDNIAALKGYHGRVDIYGAEFDGIIPIAHAKALAAAVGTHVTVLPSGHNDWMQTDQVKLD